MTDSELIAHLGGPSKVAEALGIKKQVGGVQRVWQWTKRGIPAAVKLQRPDLFLPDFTSESRKGLPAGEPSINEPA
jgi:hypothetical protein